MKLSRNRPSNQPVDHEDRNDRRSSAALIAALYVTIACTVSIIVLLVAPGHVSPVIFGVIAAVGLVGIFGSMFLAAFWSSNRVAAFAVFLAFLATVLLGGLGLEWIEGMA